MTSTAAGSFVPRILFYMSPLLHDIMQYSKVVRYSETKNRQERTVEGIQGFKRNMESRETKTNCPYCT